MKANVTPAKRVILEVCLITPTTHLPLEGVGDLCNRCQNCSFYGYHSTNIQARLLGARFWGGVSGIQRRKTQRRVAFSAVHGAGDCPSGTSPNPNSLHREAPLTAAASSPHVPLLTHNLRHMLLLHPSSVLPQGLCTSLFLPAKRSRFPHGSLPHCIQVSTQMLPPQGGVWDAYLKPLLPALDVLFFAALLAALNVVRFFETFIHKC